MFVAILGNPCQRMYIPMNVYASICLKFIFKKKLCILIHFGLKIRTIFQNLFGKGCLNLHDIQVILTK